MHRIKGFFVSRIHEPIEESATALTPRRDTRISSDVHTVFGPRDSGKTAP
jgi:hypothetical protein